MGILKSIGRAIVLMISGIAIVVVGGFMMGAVTKFYFPGNKKDKQDPPRKIYDREKSDHMPDNS